MTLDNRIEAFIKLGSFLRWCVNNNKQDTNPDAIFQKHYSDFEKLIQNIKIYNPWFTENNVRFAIAALGNSLTEENLKKWLLPYRNQLETEKKTKNIAVVMAGNIPAVGFHDFLSVLISGNRFIGKLSSDDDKLIPAIANILMDYEPEFGKRICFSEGKLENFDAVIATGSNNTSRYFEYYFGKYPHILRHNRNAIAILTGKESEKELNALGNDILIHFGMGCRNVSKLFVPEDYSFKKFFEANESWNDLANHNKYRNNYDYYKSIFLINSVPFADNGFLLLKEDRAIASPVSVINFEKYGNLEVVEQELNNHSENIQCVIGNNETFATNIPFGKAQQPELWDYADGVDTMKFLVNL